MSTETNVGVLGLGVYLPPEIRRNDWWPPEVVSRWAEGRRKAGGLPPPEGLTEGARRVLQAMEGQAHDPFQGVVERHVMPSDMSTLDMEERASRAAVTRAGVDPGAIDLLLTNTTVPEFLLGNPACALHHRLGLAKACFSMHTDMSTYSFMAQLTLAEAMIRAGRARCALLVQSCAPSRLVDTGDALSAYFGDAATAVVVGPVAGDRGFLASVSYADGRNPRSLVASVPGGAWYDEGRAVLHVGDPRQARDVFLGTADMFKECVGEALARARHTHADVDFFCAHQGASWLRRIAQDYVGLSAARSIDTFAQTGHLFGSTLPFALASAEEQRRLADGDLVVLAAGGQGTTYGAAVLRWGRAA